MPQGSSIIPFLKQFVVSLCPALIQFFVGTQASMLPMLIVQCKETLGFALSEDDIPRIVTTYSVSAMLGMLLACKIVNYSRKMTALLATFLATLSAIVTYTATSYTILMCSQAIVGLSSGIAFIVFPIYIGECASPKYRT